MSTTPNMNLTLPVPSTTPGPQWATQVNSAFSVVDQHNHTFGSGVPVPTSGLNINADLPFNSHAALGLTSVTFSGANVALAGAIYADPSGNLYYNNSGGTPVQITAGNSLSATSLGGITGLVSPAEVVFDLGTGTFTFTQDSITNTPGQVDSGPLTVRRASANSFGVTLEPASGIAAGYTLSLPTALPGANSFLTATSGGAVGYVSQTGGITRTMIVATGQQITGTTTASASGSTYTALTSTLTLVTSGNPVIIGITGDASGSDSSITMTPSSTGGRMKGWLKTIVDSTVDAGIQMIELEAPGTGYLQLPSSSYAALLPLSAGTHTFRLYGKTQPSGGGYVTTSIGINNAKFFVYEL